MKTTIPSWMLKELSKISELGDAEMGGLRQLFLRNPARLYPFSDGFWTKVERALPSLEQEPRTELVEALHSYLYLVATSSQLPDSLLRLTEDRLKDVVNDGKAIAVTMNLLSALVRDETLLLSIKATSLYEESEHLLMDTKLLVDLRPVFDPHEPDTIAANTVLFKLRLTYRERASSDLRTMFFTVRRDELEELADAIARSSMKAEAVGSAQTTRILESSK